MNIEYILEVNNIVNKNIDDRNQYLRHENIFESSGDKTIIKVFNLITIHLELIQRRFKLVRVLV